MGERGAELTPLRWGGWGLKGAPQGLPCQPLKSGFVESVSATLARGLGTDPALRGAQVLLPHLGCAEVPPHSVSPPAFKARGSPRPRTETPSSRLNLRLS